MITRLSGALFICMVVFGGQSCNKDKVIIEETNILPGAWQWLRTDGGIADHIHDTPINTGKSVKIELGSGNKYIIRTNGDITEQGTYTLSNRTCVHDHTQKVFIQFSHGGGWMVEKMESNLLYLSDEYADGVMKTFRKVK